MATHGTQSRMFEHSTTPTSPTDRLLDPQYEAGKQTHRICHLSNSPVWLRNANTGRGIYCGPSTPPWPPGMRGAGFCLLRGLVLCMVFAPFPIRLMGNASLLCAGHLVLRKGKQLGPRGKHIYWIFGPTWSTFDHLYRHIFSLSPAIQLEGSG